MADKDPAFLKELVDHHISGQLRVAPEHVSEQVLRYMGKPSHPVYEKFLKAFERCNRAAGKEQYAVPYFMSSHPGCGLKEAVELAEYIRDMGFIPEQAQDLSHACHAFHLHVLYRAGSANHETGPCPPLPMRKPCRER